MGGAGDIPEHSAADARQTPPLARPLRLLVIDDDHDVADSLGMLMESFGAEVRIAYDGASGLEAVYQFEPEIVCIDVHMPGIDGYETARRMRERLGDRTPRLVALTGLGHHGDRERARVAGFDMHLAKPAPMASLESLARRGTL